MNNLQVPEEGQETLLKSWTDTDWLVDILMLSATPPLPTTLQPPRPLCRGCVHAAEDTGSPAVDYSTVPER